MSPKTDSTIAFTIRQMAFTEIPAAIAIFTSHDLVESLSIVRSFYRSDPAAFLVAVRPDTGAVIGAIGAPLTTHHTRFVGLYAVDKDHQGLGIGKQLFDTCMATVVGTGNAGLASVPDKFDIYKSRCGFSQEEGVAIEFYEGVPKLDGLKTANQLAPNLRLIVLDKKNPDQNLVGKIVDYDTAVHLDSREALIRCELDAEDTTTIAILDQEEDDKCVGFGCVRPDFLERPMLGPIYADSPDIAQVLTRHLLESSPNYLNSDILLVTTSNSGMKQIAETILGLPFVERDEKLFTSRVPPFSYRLLYCCHTPSFAC